MFLLTASVVMHRGKSSLSSIGLLWLLKTDFSKDISTQQVPPLYMLHSLQSVRVPLAPRAVPVSKKAAVFYTVFSFHIAFKAIQKQSAL